MLLSQSDIQHFKDDGVVLLRGVFEEWIDILSKGADFNLGDPSERVLIHETTHRNRLAELAIQRLL